MNQYYGVTETGQTRYVAMSVEEVEEYAKKHPEEEITRVEDKWGSVKKSLREYIEPTYTGSGHKVKDATSDKFNIGDRVQFDDGDWKNRTGTIKDIFENNYGVVCAEVTFDHAFKNYPGGTTMALKSLRKLDESFTRKTLRESLKDWDRKEFEENSNSYELEMLYESVKTTLSAQQKNDLARFVRKAKTAEEVNTYMTGMLAQNQMSESYAEKDAAKIENILAHSDILWSWGDDNTIDFAGDYEAEKAAKLLKRFKGSIDFEENQLIFESLKEEKVYSPRDSISKDFDKKIEDILDDNGIIETVEYGAINDVSPKRALKIKNILDNLGYNCEILDDYDICQILIKESLTEDVDDDYFGSDYEQNLNRIKDLAYDLEIALNDLDVWVDDVWYDGYDKTITVFVTNGDWKHDHWKLDNFLREWIDQNNLDADLRTNDLESDSDVYDAYHIIRFRSLNEGYVAQKPTRFTNGQVRDFDPYTFIKNIMRSGQSMNSVRDCGQDQYTIFVNYKDHFGPRGIDNPDTLYTIDIIKEDPSGEQIRELTETDLLWNEVAEVLQDWKEDKCLNEGITPINEAYSYRKVNKAILKAISDLGGECFETVDNNSSSYRFEGKVSRRSLINDLASALQSTGYEILSDNSGIEVQDNDNWWQGTNIEIYNDTDNQEKGYSFFIIGIYDLS